MANSAEHAYILASAMAAFEEQQVAAVKEAVKNPDDPADKLLFSVLSLPDKKGTVNLFLTAILPDYVASGNLEKFISARDYEPWFRETYRIDTGEPLPPSFTSELQKEQERRFLEYYEKIIQGADDKKLKKVTSWFSREVKKVAHGNKKAPSAVYKKMWLWPDLEATIRTLGSPGAYLEVAKYNVDHFSPGNLEVYETGHRIALKFALLSKAAAAEGNAEKAAECLRISLIYEGIASHFLVDHFTSGHSFQPRELALKKLGSAKAGYWGKKAHDQENRYGALYIDRNGAQWHAKGEGYFLDKDNTETLDHTTKAVSSSVHEIFCTAGVNGFDKVVTHAQTQKLFPEHIIPQTADKVRYHPLLRVSPKDDNTVERRAKLNEPLCDQYVPLEHPPKEKLVKKTKIAKKVDSPAPATTTAHHDGLLFSSSALRHNCPAESADHWDIVEVTGAPGTAPSVYPQYKASSPSPDSTLKITDDLVGAGSKKPGSPAVSDQTFATSSPPSKMLPKNELSKDRDKQPTQSPSLEATT